MNRRGFLTRLLKSGIYAAVAPQIVTHGLKFLRPRPPLFDLDGCLAVLYKIKNERLAAGSSDVIDVYTDRLTAVRFQEMGLDYFNAMFDSEKRMSWRLASAPPTLMGIREQLKLCTPGHSS